MQKPVSLLFLSLTFYQKRWKEQFEDQTAAQQNSSDKLQLYNLLENGVTIGDDYTTVLLSCPGRKHASPKHPNRNSKLITGFRERVEVQQKHHPVSPHALHLQREWMKTKSWALLSSISTLHHAVLLFSIKGVAGKFFKRELFREELLVFTVYW